MVLEQRKWVFRQRCWRHEIIQQGSRKVQPSLVGLTVVPKGSVLFARPVPEPRIVLLEPSKRFHSPNWWK